MVIMVATKGFFRDVGRSFAQHSELPTSAVMRPPYVARTLSTTFGAAFVFSMTRRSKLQGFP